MAKVLISDDAAFMRMMLRNVLVEGGHEVVAEAENGLQAIEFYELHQPDVLILDITMPEMDGIQALIAIKTKHPQANVIMCSAIGQQDMVIKAIQSGAKTFIVKPFNKEKVLAEVAKLS